MNIGELVADKEIRYISGVNMYSKRMYTTCSEEELLRLIQTDINGEIGAIPPLWVDLVYYFSKSEPENLFNRDIQDLVYQKLIDMYNSKPNEFIIGLLSGLKYWFQGVRSYLEISNIIREIEPIDQLPEVKTRLYRIPIYTQILESILSNLFRSLRDIIGAFLEKDYSNQINLGNFKDVLSAKGFENLFRFVDIDVRNAISHGRVIVSPWDVLFIYTSGKTKQEREKTWTVRDIFGETAYALLGAGKPHFDDFIEGSFDDAGGIIVGFFRFFCKHPEVIVKNLEHIQSDEYLSREYLCRFFSFPECVCTSIDTGITGSSQLNLHFFVSESDHDQLAQHALEAAIIASGWISNYQRYMVCYRHLRMPPGTIRFNKNELDAILNNQILPEDVMKEVRSRGDFMLLFKANDEEIDLEAVKRFRYPLIDGDKWKLREVGDVSNEENKRFRANLYIPQWETKSDIVGAVNSAVHRLKLIENPPSPSMKIKHGHIPADAIYLHVFRKRSRRKNRVISIDNPNFICLVEWHSDNCPALKDGGIPKNIWDKLDTEKHDNILFSCNPNFIHEYFSN